MQVGMKSNANQVMRRMQRLTGQMPFAASKALNATGNVLLAVNKREMRKQFDKPVPYTMNAFYMKRSTKADLNVRIGRKSKPSGKHYLEVQHSGGTRPRKGIESLLNYSIAYRNDLRAVLPTKRTTTGAGGISTAQVLQAIAGLGGKMPNEPYTKSRVEKAEARRAAQKNPSQYFIGYKEDGKNTTDGIYRRRGKRVEKMFHLLEYRPKYRENFPFHPPLYRNARSYFPQTFKRELFRAMRTAR